VEGNFFGGKGEPGKKEGGIRGGSGMYREIRGPPEALGKLPKNSRTAEGGIEKKKKKWGERLSWSSRLSGIRFAGTRNAEARGGNQLGTIPRVMLRGGSKREQHQNQEKIHAPAPGRGKRGGLRQMLKKKKFKKKTSRGFRGFS